MDQLIFRGLHKKRDPLQVSYSSPEESDPFFDSQGFVSGSIERVHFSNENTGQSIFVLKDSKSKETRLTSARLSLPFPSVQVSGKIQSQHNGPQAVSRILILEQISLRLPQDTSSIRKLLRSEAFPDLSPRLIKALVTEFGPKTIEYLQQTTSFHLDKIKGIGPKKKELIQEAWMRFQNVMTIRNFLFENFLSLSWSSTLLVFYGEKAISAFRKDPYELAIRHSFSFEIVDAYASTLGRSDLRLSRLKCALHHEILTKFRQGHCCIPEAELIATLETNLGLTREQVDEAIEHEILSERIISEKVSDQPVFYLRDVWRMEKQVANRLLQMREEDVEWSWFNTEKVVSWAENLLGISLAHLQKEAIITSFSHKISIITGGPGTGKTTLIQALLSVLKTQSVRVVLCSPTGRGARRLEEVTGIPAQTLHRLLKFDNLSGDFHRSAAQPVDADLVLIDEFSMVDVTLMYHLLESIGPHCALVLVGDADQLPSVGAGNILQSMISSERFPTVKLVEIFRQGEKSLIKVNAQLVNSGQVPLMSNDEKSDFKYYPVHSPEQARARLFDLISNEIPKKYHLDNIFDYQILVPQNSGELGIIRLNQELQNCFVKDSHSQEFIVGLNQSFYINDKVMVIKNDYIKNVFNGDIGFIKTINLNEEFLEVRFEDRLLRFELHELDKLTLAYAISIHKSQGSEYRAVVVIMTEEHKYLAQRHLLYTAITRGREEVFLIADPSTLETCVSSMDHNKRWQKLTELLKV